MASSDSTRLSEKAVSGFAKAALYEEHRPSYPQHAVALLLDAAAVSGYKGARLVDLAAGTGKFTELLAAQEEQFSVAAIEPHQEMRKQLEQKALRNVTVTDGVSTAIPEETESVDAVFAAQVRCGSILLLPASPASCLRILLLSPFPCSLSWFPSRVPATSSTLFLQSLVGNGCMTWSARQMTPSLLALPPLNFLTSHLLVHASSSDVPLF
jgi:hypothetical protein